MKSHELSKLEQVWFGTTNVHLMNESYLNGQTAIEVEDGKPVREIVE